MSIHFLESKLVSITYYPYSVLFYVRILWLYKKIDKDYLKKVSGYFCFSSKIKVLVKHVYTKDVRKYFHSHVNFVEKPWDLSPDKVKYSFLLEK